MPAELQTQKYIKPKKAKISKAAFKLKNEDMEILVMLEKLKRELDFLHNNFDQITDPVLIDSCIFEMKAIHMKYQYYLNECKERGIVMHQSGAV